MHSQYNKRPLVVECLDQMGEGDEWVRGFGRLLVVWNYPLSYTCGNPCRKWHMPRKESRFALSNSLLITCHMSHDLMDLYFLLSPETCLTDSRGTLVIHLRLNTWRKLHKHRFRNRVTRRVLQSILFFTVGFCSKWNRVSLSRFTVNGITLMTPP